MTQPFALTPTTRTARLLHGALFAGATTIAVVLSAIRPDAGVGPDVPAALLRYVTLGVLAVDLLVARGLRARIPPLTPPDGEATYWAANLKQAIIGWAVIESAVLFGAVIHFATGDWVPLVAAAVALGALWGHRPGRLIAP